MNEKRNGMPVERWEEVDVLFDEVLATAPDERLAYLEKHCEDPELHAAVLELLDSSERASDFLEVDGTGLNAELVRDAITDWADANALTPGDRVGAYVLVDVLGRGGIGTVFLAERDDGEYRQRVALKVLRRGLDTDDLLARFRTERQILALLSHPAIARLLDGGATADGRPYLVMECVDGVPITEYCDRHRLPVRERIRLCTVVAHAVRHAHRNLIVHRDIKPSNILVAEVQDGTKARAEVKLLDFGIAKLLDPERLPAAVPPTRTEVRLMTPEYATPEQVRGEPVTTATDVYQLGILLYELLTGRHPQPLGGAGPLEVERIVCHTDPPLASASVGGETSADASTLAQQRGTEPGRLIRKLRGDLDTIIRMALRKEPERRYASVEQLVDDLDRYLAGQPIMARCDSRLYRARKFVRRHPLGTVATAVAGLAAAGYLATVAIYTDRLEHERDRARLEAAHAEQVAGFLTDIFQVSEPGAERGDTLRARTLLDRGAARIAAAKEDDPAVRARMLEVIGAVYRQLGAYDGAKATLEEALRLRESLHGSAHAELATVLRELALLRMAQAELDAAESLARRAVAIERQNGGARHPSVSAANVLGMILQERGDYAEAQTVYQQALERVERAGNEPAQRAAVLNNLGVLLRERGEHAGALPMLREALALRQAQLGPDHPTTAASMNGLGTLLRDLGELDEAAELLQRSLEVRRRQLGDDHPQVATALNNLALLHRSRGDYGAAEALHREALVLRLRLHGENHPDVASSLYNLAETLRSAGRLAEAEESYRRAIDGWRVSLGGDHPRIAFPMNGLAEVFRLRGETAAAAALLEEALTIRRAALGERHPLVASTLTVLALLHRDRREFARAEAHIQEAIEIRRERVGEGHPQYAHALVVLGSIRNDRGRPRAAEPILHQALTSLDAAAGDVEPRLIADARIALARALLLAGRPDDARPHAKEGLRIVERKLGERNARNRVALELLADINEAQSRFTEAAAYRQRLASLP